MAFAAARNALSRALSRGAAFQAQHAEPAFAWAAGAAPAGGAGAQLGFWAAARVAGVRGLSGQACAAPGRTGTARELLRPLAPLRGAAASVLPGRAAMVVGGVRHKKVPAGAGLKAYRPTSPGQRGRVITSRVGLHKGKPVKALVFGLRSTGGRGHDGRTCTYKRGGGHKRKYRIVDFKRRHFGTWATVERLEYDPNRSSRIALLQYDDPAAGCTHTGLSYILAPIGLQPGDKVMSGPGAPIKPGCALPIEDIPIGTALHNIEMLPGKGGQMIRSAGGSATLIRKADDGYAILKLSSGEQRLVLQKCMATVGRVGNEAHMNRKLGKAGASRWIGRRPTVRGVAMNPVDHPHGGGEGKTSGGRHPCTPWGKNTKGAKTRRNKRTQKFIRVSRHLMKK
eukprot:CAMPEP_0182871502 /NCGR_PEP_ID=MMETSP0034_2-20130328/11159_1 /TAXON_ID=156128 /ORGANISM="Nephroselmis pyriformis, Strain CCMP717" /LENGTH=395 /DNA_ID=CAMNT_0025004059 /DNA_START=39 /DNA_END=1223 /DNA_ORIENTATION=-